MPTERQHNTFRIFSILILSLSSITIRQLESRILKPCELVRELRRLKVPANQIATWVCIAKYESRFNTEAIGHLNKDGSGDHGLFQLNDRYWCSLPGMPERGCKVTCAQLRVASVAPSMRCARKVFAETQRLRGNGFAGWTTYEQHCKQPKAEPKC